MPEKSPHLLLTFTYGVSLKDWVKTGVFDREVALYRALVQKNYRVTFLTYGGKEDLELEGVLPGIEILPLYAILPKFPLSKLNLIESFLGSPFLLSRLRSVDLIKTNQMWGAWLACELKTLLKKPLIVRSGYELLDFEVRAGSSFLKRSFVRGISKTAYGMADRIVQTSPQSIDWVTSEFKIDRDRIELIPNLIDTELFRPLEIEKKKNAVLFVGRLNRQKNLGLLFRAAKEAGVEVHLAGEGEEKEKLEALGKELSLKVTWLGRVPNSKLPELLNSYPAFVLPSDYEGNPKTLLEAQSAGTPVIGTDVSGIREAITSEVDGVLVKPNVKALSQAIKRVLSDPECSRKLSHGGRARILKNNSLPEILKKEEALYQSLLKK